MSSNDSSRRKVISQLNEHIVEVDGQPRVEVETDGRRHTVELRQIFEFERDILDRLIEPSIDDSVTGNAVPIKGEWIYGWLDVKGEDYINNIWKNYQYFLKYIQARTSIMENVSTHQRSPGTYDSMYRYLLLLEDLELLERYRRESVEEDEYDFPVPEEFRKRTFIRLTSDFESNEDIWRNPYEALYGSDEEQSDTTDESEEVQIPIEEEPIEEDSESGDSPASQLDIPEPEEVDRGEGRNIGIEGVAPDEESDEDETDIDLPEEGASFSDFPQKTRIPAIIRSDFPEAMERTFNEAPAPTEGVEPEDFSVAQIAVFGTWVVGEATPGNTPLELIVSIDDTDAPRSPGFVPAGLEVHLTDIMLENNEYEDIFPSYSIVSVYNSAFNRKLDEIVRREQSELVYFDLQDMELKEL